MTPAPDCIAPVYRTDMGATSTERLHPTQSGYLHRFTAWGSGAVTQLTIGIVTPAPDITIIIKGTAEIRADHDIRHGHRHTACVASGDNAVTED